MSILDITIPVCMSILIYVPFILLFTIKKHRKFYILPFIVGVANYYIAVELFAYKLILKFSQQFEYEYGDNYKIIYLNQLLNSYLIAFCSVTLCFILIILCNKKANWSSSIKRNMFLGIGWGWLSAVFYWKSFFNFITQRVKSGVPFYYYGFDNWYILSKFAKSLADFFLFTGIALFLQISYREKKSYIFLPVCVLLYTLSDFYLSYVRFTYNRFTIVSMIIYVLFSIATLVGSIFYVKWHQRKRH